MSDSLQHYGLYPAMLLCPWDSPGKNTGVGCHALLQGILPTQGSNSSLLCLLHGQVGSLPLGPPEKPKYHLQSLKKRKREILKWKSNKHVQNLYAKNYKTLMRDIKDHLNQWRNIPCSWIERQCSRISIILTLNEGLNTTPIKITAWYFVYTDGLH